MLRAGAILAAFQRLCRTISAVSESAAAWLQGELAGKSMIYAA
jgi:hypothetical protein